MEDEEIIFEKIFESLIEETNKILIEYDYKVGYYKEHSYAQYSIKKINGESPYSFKRKIIQLGKKGILLLNQKLEKTPYEYRIEYLEEFKDELSYIKEVVKKDKFITEESEFGPREEEDFWAFQNATLKPNSSERVNGHEKSILLKASEFAKGYLEAIDGIEKKIEFIVNQMELMPEPKEAIKDKNIISVFYSWQSDKDSDRKLIWKALRKLENEFKNKERKIQIESDMRGTSGSQDIPNTLFKKISEADLFICDVNLVGLSIYREGATPNPNVLIELGYAAAKLGWDRIILIMNTKHNKIEELPFDIRHRSVLWYDTDPEKELFSKLKIFVKAIIEK
jgi:hypothetical protein